MLEVDLGRDDTQVSIAFHSTADLLFIVVSCARRNHAMWHACVSDNRAVRTALKVKSDVHAIPLL